MLLICCATYAQHQKIADTEKLAEKVFVHTDRDIYVAGENIWFKAYLINAQTHKLSFNSKTLYVELISPLNKIVKHIMVRLNDGTGHADISLDEALVSGNYRLRAYTNWMRNFDENLFFEKQLWIQQKSENATNSQQVILNTDNNVYNNTANDSKPEQQIDLLFFPEGGSLVNQLSSIVGVKAENQFGKGTVVDGIVVSSLGDTVTRFKCDSLGFGILTLFPVAGVEYYASIIQNHKVKYKMPRALPAGLSLKIETTGPNVKINIVAAGIQPSILEKPLKLVFKHAGSAVLTKDIIMTGNNEAQINVLKQDLPSGLNCLTLYDAQGMPHCERLLYIDHGNIAINLVVDSLIHRPDSVTRININLIAKNQQPLKAKLSVSVINSSLLSNFNPDIRGYLELESEVKGTIANSYRYFDINNVNRFKQMDILLLTQGWRNYTWKNIDSIPSPAKFPAEQGITVTGRVRSVYRDKGMAGLNISLRADKAVGQKLFSAQTDSSGKFRIDNLVFYGYQYLNLNAMNTKGVFKGYIQADSVRYVPPTVQPNSRLVIDPLTIKPSLVALSKLQENPLIPANTIRLQQVVVKETPNRYVKHTKSVQITQKEHHEYSTLMNYLIYNLNGVKTYEFNPSRCGSTTPSGETLTSLKIKYPQQGAFFSIAGKYADNSPLPECTIGADFMDLPMSQVLSLTITQTTHMQGGQVFAVVKPGALDKDNFFSKTSADVNGYYKAREFYRSNKNDEFGTDSQPTIYWQPNLNTDETGKAAFNIKNPTVKRPVSIIIQGLTELGVPVFGIVNYSTN